MLKKSAALIFLLLLSAVPQAQRAPAAPKVSTPKEQFGWEVGDDYRLVNYTQFTDYLKKMDVQSERMTVVDIGKTEEGRTEFTAIITSSENQRKLPLIKEANRKLALAEGLTDETARQLARDGKIVVWIDGGLHATEVLGAQQLIETIYRLNTRNDAETLRILNDVVILCTLVNPDGMELVSNWYMRNADDKQKSTGGVPRLYQKYIGHDDNRDFYMMNMSESANANKMMYREWFPAIMYNHHQTGPAGAVLFAPPFRDPFNYNFDPLIPLGIDMVGAAIHTRLAAEGKPGAVMRSGAPYSTWFNGGIRTTSYFHNQIGILTETIGNPTPVEIPFVLDMQLPRADVPNPIAPGIFPFRTAIEYSITNNMAILDIASKRHEDFLFNMYKMAKNAIDKGNRDSWTIHPQRIKAAEAAIQAAQGAQRGASAADGGGRGGRGGGGRGGAPIAIYNSVLRDPKMRDPRGFILPSDQPDFPTATKFVNVLIKGGVFVQRATAPFTVAGKQYPAGSYVVKSAQPFRAHLMDMFEPQDIRTTFHIPAARRGRPTTSPATTSPIRWASSTTAFSTDSTVRARSFRTSQRFRPERWLRRQRRRLSAQSSGQRFVRRGEPAVEGQRRSVVAEGAADGERQDLWRWNDLHPRESDHAGDRPEGSDRQGLMFDALAQLPAGIQTMKLKPVRIGLWDQYGGSMPSGGRAGSSSSTSSHSRSCIRRRSMPGT
jgi:hypothetical protein